MNSRFVRLAETGRAAVPICIDGQPAQALAGDTLLVALLKHGERVRDSEFGEGDDTHGATAVRVGDARGRELRFETDAVALGWHLRAEAQLADLARCEFIFEPQSRQWLPRIDADGRSSVKGVYLAGDGVRILGADGAEAAGRLAALAALADLGHAQGAQK
jgi:NADPH-dependent 2,4-dienoyl-CoA reductase/sulfur reductase-like enzyme